MNRYVPTWRKFPAGVPAVRLVEYGDISLSDGDVVGAGNWYIHAKRLGAAGVKGKLQALIPQLEQLVASGDSDAKALLAGVLLDAGNDLQGAAQLFREASDAGVAEGERGLGFMLTNGVGVPRDSAAANRLFLAAAQKGDGYAAYNLAINYYNADGVMRNAREFMRWLRQASECGIPEACALLGDSASSQNRLEEALHWYVRAAESGHVPAMREAASRFRDGVGAEPDPVQAVRWFLAMLDRGNGDGIHEAIQLARGMSVDQVREAGHRAGRENEAEILIRRTR